MLVNRLAAATTASALAQRLREAIDAGQWKPGELLRQEQIAAEYGVSRIPVREALAQLQTEGLLEVAHYRGARVSRPRAEEVDELFDLRLLVEGDLLMRALEQHEWIDRKGGMLLANITIAALIRTLARQLAEARDGEAKWRSLSDAAQLGLNVQHKREAGLESQLAAAHARLAEVEGLLGWARKLMGLEDADLHYHDETGVRRSLAERIDAAPGRSHSLGVRRRTPGRDRLDGRRDGRSARSRRG